MRNLLDTLRLLSSADNNMTVRQACVLFFIEQKKCFIDFREIYRGLNIPPASLSRNISSLIKMGFVKNWRNDQDRRRVFVDLTEEGRKIVQEIFNHEKNKINI